MRKRSWVREWKIDAFALAVDAVASGGWLSMHWQTLLERCRRDGVDGVALALSRRSAASERWWRCHLLLAEELSIDRALALVAELVDAEALNEGPAFDIDRHALEVSSAVRYLQAHLDRLKAELATSRERDAVAMVVRVSRLARGWGFGQWFGAGQSLSHPAGPLGGSPPREASSGHESEGG